MRKIVGTCPENCPTLALLGIGGEARDKATMHDGLVAEAVSDIPNVRELIQSQCDDEGPHKVFFGFGGKVACGSDFVENYPLYEEAAADSATFGLGDTR